MAKYFSYFPTTLYRVSNDSVEVDVITNLLTRFKMNDELKENTSIYYKYDIQDGDTPETIAYNIYGSAERHWVILLMNNIVDPQYDWPLEFRTLSSFIDKKYSANNYADTANTGVSGLVWSRTNTHSYYINEITEYSGNTFSQILQIDPSTYANTVTGASTITLQDGVTINQSNVKSSLSYYEYEMQENEKKRSIKILKNEFMFALEQELRNALKQ